jgi:hypothetical protein
MPDKKNLPATTSPAQRNALQNSGSGSRSLLDLATSNLTQEELAAIRQKALEERLRLEVDAQQRNLDNQLGRRAAEDHVDMFNSLEKGGKLTSQKLVSDIKTGAGNMRIESKSGTTCFVATAAYGDPDHEDVAFLRQYRNKTLRNTVLGRAFIASYWKVGPALARPVRANKTLQRIARRLIGSLVKLLRQRERNG